MLGYKFGNLNDAEVNREINKSFENVSIFTPRRKKSHDYGEGLGQESAFFSTNKITNIFSDELLTPLRERVQKQFALFGVDHRSKLPVCECTKYDNMKAKYARHYDSFFLPLFLLAHFFSIYY